MEVTPDKASGTITIKVDGAFTADQAAELLNQIAKARAEVHSESRQLPSAIGVVPVAEVNYHTLYPGPAGTILLAMRHPGFGWLGWSFATDGAAELGMNLNKMLAAALRPAVATPEPTTASGTGLLH